MRIAYIAPYQGPELLKRRPIIRNLSLAANVKMELVAELLQQRGHKLEIISQGEVVEFDCKFYPAFQEKNPFDPDIPISYTSALPVRFVNGLWSSIFTLRRFQARHRTNPYDAVIIYNMKTAQVACANYAIHRLGLPVILEFEDDAFVSLGGERQTGFKARRNYRSYTNLLSKISGGIAVSPHLRSRMPSGIPTLLLPGVVDEHITAAGNKSASERNNWIVYSGTHFRSKGLQQLIEAWQSIELPGWELHVAGRGELTESLEAMGKDDKSIVFHGLLDRSANARLLSLAKIGMNPHDVSATPGNVFAFKIIEYLAAGAHVISTPMGPLQRELEAGITYIDDNSPQAIAAALQQVVQSRDYERTAVQAALGTYGPAAAAKALDDLLGAIRTPKA